MGMTPSAHKRHQLERIRREREALGEIDQRPAKPGWWSEPPRRLPTLGELNRRAPHDRNVPRYGRPAEAIVKRGQSDERDKRRKIKRTMILCSGSFFVPRACLLASLQKSGVVFYEIDRIECRSKDGRTEICPTLPVIERTRRDEYHGAQRQRA